MGTNHPVLDAAGLAFLTGLSVQLTKVLFYKIVPATSPNRAWYLRLYTVGVAQVYTFAGAWLLGVLRTGPDIATTYTLGFGVAIAAITQYHLLSDDTIPAAPTAAAAAEPRPGTTSQQEQIARWRRKYEADMASKPVTLGRVHAGAVPVKRPTTRMAEGSGRAGRPATEEVATQVQPVMGADRLEKGVVHGGGRAAAGPGQTGTEDDASHRGDEAWLAAATAAARWQERNRARGYVEGPQPDPAPDPEVPWAHGQHVSELGDGS